MPFRSSEKIGGRSRAAVALQAAYYITTGVWPLVHRRSFEAVTGPKTDFWLVQTVGAVVAAIGAGLALAVRRGALSTELQATGALAAGGLAAIDVVYATRGRISLVYLADAAVEGLFIAALAAGSRDRPRESAMAGSPASASP